MSCTKLLLCQFSAIQGHMTCYRVIAKDIIITCYGHLGTDVLFDCCRWIRTSLCIYFMQKSSALISTHFLNQYGFTLRLPTN